MRDASGSGPVRFEKNDVVRLRRDVPSQNLRSGTVGLVSEVSPGPPARYVVEFVDDAAVARATLSDEDLSPPDGAPAPDTPTDPEPDGIGLTDDQLAELIEGLWPREQATGDTRDVREQDKREQHTREQDERPVRPDEPRAVPAATAGYEPRVEPATTAGDETSTTPPSGGRRTRFVKGDAVRLDVDLPSAGFGAGTDGVVTWTILGPPVSYLVEFLAAGGGSSAPVKVEETYLSPAG